MNKAELVNQVATKTGLSRPEAAQAVDTAMDAVAAELMKGGSVRLTGLGSFVTSTRAGYQARNPQTGAPVQVPEKRIVRFLPGARLRELINGERTPAEDGRLLKKAAKGTYS
jgi:DNA-binding protein HU-beta